MDTLLLESKWSLIQTPQNNQIATLLIDADCIPDLRIGINSFGNRCIMLSFPLNFQVVFIGQTKQNITTVHRKTNFENALVIELTNNYLKSYFNDIIISLFYKIKGIQNINEYSEMFVRTIYEWCNFFANASTVKHSLEVIQGIIGELTVLYELINSADQTNVNYYLNSWKGLYDENNDFYLDQKNIEVKTKRDTKTTVRISSEFQLEPENEKSLELLVVSVEIVLVNGINLEYIIEKIKNKTLLFNGDLNILYNALNEKSLNILNFKDFNDYLFKIISHKVYETTIPNFPKIVYSELNESLTKITYDINTKNLDDFIIREQVNFNYL